MRGSVIFSLFMVAFGCCAVAGVFAQTDNARDSSKSRINKSNTVDLSFFEERANALIGRSFPSFVVKNGENVSLSLKDLKNKIVFVNFWFEGCGPCMREMDALNKLYDTLKNDKQFIFLSFTFDDEETVARVVEKFGIKYPVNRISREECYRLNAGNGFPTSFFLDKNGVIRWVSLSSIEKEIGTGELVHAIYPKIL